MSEHPSIWTLARLEAAVAGLSMEKLRARHAQCVAGGHVWRPLDATAIGLTRAEWCGWCLKMRAGGFECLPKR